jgi:excisionase family DNA binding protein
MDVLRYQREQLLTVAEVAAHFKVHASTVRRWISEGSLASVRTPGGYPRVPASALPSAGGQTA